jgi:hypothetical protein
MLMSVKDIAKRLNVADSNEKKNNNAVPMIFTKRLPQNICLNGVITKNFMRLRTRHNQQRSQIRISLGGQDAWFSPMRPGFESRMRNSMFCLSKFLRLDTTSATIPSKAWHQLAVLQNEITHHQSAIFLISLCLTIVEWN